MGSPTFLPSRNLRAVPMLDTQWILLSCRPCSHGCREIRGVYQEWKWKEGLYQAHHLGIKQSLSHQLLLRSMQRFHREIICRYCITETLTNLCPDSTSNRASSFTPSLMSSKRSLTSKGGLCWKRTKRRGINKRWT